MQGSDRMLKIRSFFVGVVLCLCSVSVWAVDLSGSAAVSITSDTAANAKTMAFDEARRQIIGDSLRQYVDVDTVAVALQNAKNSELANLVATSSIDGEKVSDTTYSANITMTLDSNAARTWLENNNVQHWLPDESKRDVFVVSVKLSDPIADWIQLNQIARNERIDLGTQSISGDMVTLELPVSARGKFTIAVREGGWRYASSDGVLKIWK